MIRDIAAHIASHGAQQVYGVPGGGPSLDLADALEKVGVEFITTYSEASAALMAGTAGRLSGRAGVAVSIKGPGLANMLPGLAACRLEAWPAVAISEAYGPTSSPAKVHKRMDHYALTAGIAKGHYFAESGPSLFPDAARLAEDEVPGPVCLDLTGAAVEAALPRSEEIPVAHNLQSVLDLMRKAERPVVIAGTLAIRQGWSDQLARLQVPVFSTAAAKGVVDETLPHAAGVYTGVGLEVAPECSLLKGCDLVVGLGLRSNELLGPPPHEIIAVNVDSQGGLVSPGIDFSATADPVDAAEVFDALSQKEWGVERVAAATSALRQHLLDGQWLPAQVYETIWSRFDGAARLVLDTGNFCTIGEHVWRARRPDWALGSGQGRYMGIGIPTAVGATLEDSSIPTVVAVGDGGIGLPFAELRLAVARRAPLVTVLMRDGGFGSIRGRAVQKGLTQAPLLLADPSWSAAAEAIGMRAAQVRGVQQLQDALSRWTPEAGPLFLECAFDPDLYLSMVERLR